MIVGECSAPWACLTRSSCRTRVSRGLADDGYLPAILGRRNPQTGAPTGIDPYLRRRWGLASTSVFSAFTLDLLLYGLSLILEFVALVVLRVREPDLPRPYRVPGGLAAAALRASPRRF